MTADDRAPATPDETWLEVTGRLSPDQVAKVLAVVDAATEADGVRPLSEHVMLHLRYGGDDPAVNVLLCHRDAPPGTDGDGPSLVGYAHLDVTDEVAGPSAEMVVDPAWRRRGYGRLLVEGLLERGDDRLRLWAHGDLPAAETVARHLGFRRVRTLWQMRRSLFAPLPAMAVPDGVRLRPFDPGADDEPWLALNALAFADHPEQGQWTIDDLRRRQREPWFDPAGFILAERADDPGQLVGFGWTKVHGEQHADQHREHRAGDGAHAHEPIGELYVVGVHPDQQGTGLGRALTVAGLRHLRARGLTQAMLYVEADNGRAIGLYQSLGFTRWDTDVLFRRG